MTVENFNAINDNFRDMILGNIQNNLYSMSAEEIDKIYTIKMTQEQKDVLDAYVVIINFNHPSTNDLIDFYWCGGKLFKIIV